jgi:penicillin-binding protein 2
MTSQYDYQPGKSPKQKFIISTLILLGIFFFYLARLFSMQVIESLNYQSRAVFVSSRSQIINTQRGRIYDRNINNPLALNRSSFALLITPGDLQNTEQRRTLIENLSQYVSLSPNQLERVVPLPSRNFDPIEIVGNITFEQVSVIAENIDLFPALSWIPKPQRSYPFGSLFAHIIGYVGDISPEELQILFNQGYTRNSVLGKTGIERLLDLDLRGRDGLLVNQVDVFGRRSDQSQIVREPVLGSSAVLTIDKRIQDLAQQALGSRIGTALVLKPDTGEILAMVSNPSYDPNLFYTVDGPTNFIAVRDTPHSPFLNRNIQSAAPPASTFKILMSLLAMEEQIIDPMHTIRCTGSITIGDRVFRCHNPNGHGLMNFYDALAQSCNIYYYTLAFERLAPEQIFNFSARLGLGNITGIDLPGEVRGLVPSREWKERTFNTPWVGGDTVNLSIGQGFLTVTPLQLSNVTAAVATGGIVHRPFVFKELRDSITYELISETTPEILFDAQLRPDTIRRVQDAMIRTITNGTARDAITTRSVSVAGKTGTAQIGADTTQRHSWFTAYAPADPQDTREQVVVTVWIDAINEWDWWAPKAANFILHGIFNNMTYNEVIQDLWPLWYITREMLVNAQR